MNSPGSSKAWALMCLSRLSDGSGRMAAESPLCALLVRSETDTGRSASSYNELWIDLSRHLRTHHTLRGPVPRPCADIVANFYPRQAPTWLPAAPVETTPSYPRASPSDDGPANRRRHLAWRLWGPPDAHPAPPSSLSNKSLFSDRVRASAHIRPAFRHSG